MPISSSSREQPERSGRIGGTAVPVEPQHAELSTGGDVAQLATTREERRSPRRVFGRSQSAVRPHAEHPADVGMSELAGLGSEGRRAYAITRHAVPVPMELEETRASGGHVGLARTFEERLRTREVMRAVSDPALFGDSGRNLGGGARRQHQSEGEGERSATHERTIPARSDLLQTEHFILH